jgi:hypothetical protein
VLQAQAPTVLLAITEEHHRYIFLITQHSLMTWWLQIQTTPVYSQQNIKNNWQPENYHSAELPISQA